MINFFGIMAEYEEFLMLDSYLLDLNDKNRIIKTFGDIFPCRYLLDYKMIIEENKMKLYESIKIGHTALHIEHITKYINEFINFLNQRITITGKKYGDIFKKTEVKNMKEYIDKIISDPKYLLAKIPKFIYKLRPKKNKNESEINNLINIIEKDLLNENKSIDIDNVYSSQDSQIKDFSYDYYNIRTINTPHNQMPTLEKDIDVYLLELKAGKWMNMLNSYSYEMGYDWKNNKIKKITDELTKYQYSILRMNNKELENLIINYISTLSWIIDYYMNTTYNDASAKNDILKNSNYISTWAFLYERSPFINSIYSYISHVSYAELKTHIHHVYKNSLVKTNDYLTKTQHKIYIYPQTNDTVQKYIPPKYRESYPDINKYVEYTIEASNKILLTNSKEEKRQINIDRVFDCRLTSYFSKCLFKNKLLSFNELKSINI